MSRLGDMIRKERETRKIPAKQVAKKAGISEGLLLDIETGKKIVESATAQRILKAMGAAADALEAMDDAVRTPALQAEVSAPKAAQRTPARTPAVEKAPVSGQWLDALGGIVRAVPVLDELGKQVAIRLEATENGKIAGIVADKVFYHRVEDDSLWRTHSIKNGDLLLIAPGAVDGLLALEVEGVRRIGRLLENGTLTVMMLGDERKSADSKKVKVLGRVIQLVRTMG